MINNLRFVTGDIPNSCKIVAHLPFEAADFNMLNRLKNSVIMPIEEDSDVGKIKKTISVNTDKVKPFLQLTLDNRLKSLPKPNPNNEYVKTLRGIHER